MTLDRNRQADQWINTAACEVGSLAPLARFGGHRVAFLASPHLASGVRSAPLPLSP